jgi:hypothetical protein
MGEDTSFGGSAPTVWLAVAPCTLNSKTVRALTVYGLTTF